MHNERGSSLIPLMAASAVVLFVGLGAATGVYQAYTSSKKQVTTSACDDMAQSTLNNFRSLGLTSRIQILRPGKSSLDQADIWVPGGLNAADRWPAADNRVILRQSGNQVEVRSFQVLEGGVSALNAILNKQQDPFGNRYCDNAEGGRYISETTPAMVVEDTISGFMENTRTFVRIQLVDLATGQIRCPAAYPLYLRPPAPATLSPHIRLPANTVDNVGLQVTVTTRYNDPAQPGVNKSCQAQARFQYPPLKDETLNQVRVQFDVDTPSQCQTTPVSARVTLSPPADGAGRGQTHLCRDLSTAGTGGPNCSGGVRPQAFTTSSDPVPCEQARFCGQSPSSAQWSIGSNGGMQLRLTYAAVPWGCRARVDVVAIDPSLNRNSVDIVGTGTVRLPACHQPSCPCGGWAGCPSGGCYSCPPPPPPPPPVDDSGPGDTSGGTPPCPNGCQADAGDLTCCRINFGSRDQDTCDGLVSSTGRTGSCSPGGGCGINGCNPATDAGCTSADTGMGYCSDP